MIGNSVLHFKIIEKLGEGGMGEVYLAEDTRLDRRVALKFLPPQFTTDSDFRARFEREAKATAALSHPNIVTVYDIAEADGRAFIVCEYVKGHTLESLEAGPSLSLELFYDIAHQICSGLSAAHGAGIVHRDIKPANILLDHNGRVRILDFGLATMAGGTRLTKVGSAAGTLLYMSPEQVRGEEVDSRSDIFSLGAVLYELLAGRSAFGGPYDAAIVYSIAHDPPDSLAGLRADLPEGLIRIIDKALAKSKEQRYASADELRAALDGVFKQPVDLSDISRVSQVGAGAAAPKVKSLAVLHLANLGSPDDDFLSYGITEDLIVDLTRVGSIRIPSMRKVLKFKDSDLELEEIAQKLDVTMVLDGSIHKSASAIRVSAQVIDVASDETLWADRWEEPPDRLPQIKRSLAEGVSHALGLRSTEVKSAQVGLPDAQDPHAYENYLRGKFAFEHKKDAGDIDIALGLYRLALKEEPTLVSAQAGIAEVLIHQGKFPAAEQELQAALSVAEKSGSKPDCAAILRLLAFVQIRQSNWSEAWAYGERALALDREAGNLAGEAEALGHMISVLQPQARFDEALALFDRVVEINRQVDDKEKTAEALKNMGVAYSRIGQYDKALELYTAGLEIARSQENLRLQAMILSNIGNVYYFRHEFKFAQRHYKEALEINERLEHKLGAAKQTQNLGLLHILQSEYEQGLAYLNRASEIFLELGDRSTYALTMANISQVQRLNGEPEAAIQAARRALEIAEEVNYPVAQVEAHHCLGAAYAFEGKTHEALGAYHRALEIAEQAQISRDFARVHLDLASLHFYSGELALSRSHAERASALATGLADKVNGLHAAALLAALDYVKRPDPSCLKRLRDLSRAAKPLGEAELAIQVEMLLGCSLLRHGGSESDRTEGTRILGLVLESAREKKLAPHVREVEACLGSA